MTGKGKTGGKGGRWDVDRSRTKREEKTKAGAKNAYRDAPFDE